MYCKLGSLFGWVKKKTSINSSKVYCKWSTKAEEMSKMLRINSSKVYCKCIQT